VTLWHSIRFPFYLWLSFTSLMFLIIGEQWWRGPRPMWVPVAPTCTLGWVRIAESVVPRQAVICQGPDGPVISDRFQWYVACCGSEVCLREHHHHV